LYKTNTFTNFENQPYVSCFSSNANLCDDVPQILGTPAWRNFYGSLSANLFIRVFFFSDLKDAVSDLLKLGTIANNKSDVESCP